MPPEDEGLLDDGELTQAQTTATPDRPEWLPDNFDSGEALAESYKHAQRKISEQGQALADERTRREAAEALAAEQPAPQQQPYSPQQDPLVAAYEHAYQEGDATMMLAVQAELATRAAQQVMQQQPKPEPAGAPVDLDALAYQAEQAVWGQYGEEYAGLRNQTLEKLRVYREQLIGDDKTFTGVQKGIDLAYQLARGEKLAGDQRKAAQAEAEAETARREKRQAQTATGSGSRPASTDESKQHWQRIVGAPDTNFRVPTS